MTTITQRPHIRTRPAQRTRARLPARFDADNLAAAVIIVATPLKYPGLPLAWARSVIEGREAEQRASWRLVA